MLDAADDGAGAPDPAGLDAGDPDQPAYFLFTSGSTGQPKCVACSHRPLAHFVEWQARAYGLEPSDRFTLLSGLSHDPVLRDVFTPLSLGAQLVIPRQATLTDPGALAAWMQAVKATVAHITPPLGELLIAGARPQRLPGLRRLFWGGDLLPPALVRRVAAVAPACRQVNYYGATETPQAVGVFDCADDLTRATVPIGAGSEGSQLLLLDAQGAPVGPGEVGEIAVSSAYPCLGYVEDGVIRTLAGHDGHGLRTATGVSTCPAARSCCSDAATTRSRCGATGSSSPRSPRPCRATAVQRATTLAAGEGQHLRIVAFAVLKAKAEAKAKAGGGGEAATAAGLEAFLAERLPPYMQPKAIRLVDALPLTANGKVDRKALVAQAEADEAQSAPTSAPVSDAERALIEA